MTNNPDKVRALTDHGITVVERVAHESLPNHYNWSYLTAKRDRLGHTLQRTRLTTPARRHVCAIRNCGSRLLRITMPPRTARSGQ